MPLRLELYQREDLRRALIDFFTGHAVATVLDEDAEGDEEETLTGDVVDCQLIASDTEVDDLLEELIRAAGYELRDGAPTGANR